jgi:hypothetical protein
MLVTGPTGSGKTTTLYASLNYLNNMFRKIITVEDPVEFTLDGIVQGHIDPKLDLTYTDFLKSMMRQDPDVLMVGEIRDRVGAEAVIQSALTGHKVLSTFHTEDTTGALLRLIDIGIDPFLISSTVVAVLSQRLVRVLCHNCRQPFTPRKEVVASFVVELDGVKPFIFFQPKGCLHCNGTGFKGRVALHELLVVNEAIRNAILGRHTSSQIRLIAREEAALVSMREDGFYKATQGVTTLEEIMRVVFHHDSDAVAPRSAKQIIALCEGREPSALPRAARDKKELRAVPKSAPPISPVQIFTNEAASAPLEGESYRIRFDANTIESETERIADFFEVYRSIKKDLGESVDGELLGDFMDFIVDTVKRLSRTEGAEFAEFSLHVRDKKDRIFVESLLSHQDPLPPRHPSLESGLRQVGYLK